MANKMNYKLFYRPEGAFCADFIPFRDDGQFRLFYLYDRRGVGGFGEGTPWHRVDTPDFVHFSERGEMLPRGAADEQDLYIFTGSVIKAMGEYHIFYTAHNHHLDPVEVVERASSPDLEHWTKHPDERFGPDPAVYEVNDFRDPFVFLRPDGSYSMLLVSRERGAGLRAGFTAEYVSDNLRSWRFKRKFYAPGLYHTHECPDFFELGGRNYLIFSEYSDRRLTRYTVGGPDQWHSPDDDVFDSPAYYAAKTALAPDGKRYLFGWIATRSNDRNANWDWGGNLGVHEIFALPDGSLGVREPESVAAAFKMGEPAPFSLDGRCSRDAITVCGDTGSTFRAEIELTADTREFDVQFNSGADADTYYKYTITRDSIYFRVTAGRTSCPEMRRPLRLSPDGRRRLTLLADGDVCITYVDGEVACSARCDNIQSRMLSLGAFGGKAEGTIRLGKFKD